MLVYVCACKCVCVYVCVCDFLTVSSMYATAYLRVYKIIDRKCFFPIQQFNKKLSNPIEAYRPVIEGLSLKQLSQADHLLQFIIIR